MSKKFIKIALVLLVVVLTLTCVMACNKEKTFKITVMDGEREVATFDVEQNGQLTKESVLAKLEKEGYDFVGLYTDADLTEAFVFENEVIAEVTLYAKYTQKQLYISVKAEEGASTVEKVAVKTGETYSVPAPTKEGYTFTGYTYLNDEEEEVAFPQTGTYSFSTNTRLTAHWTKKSYTVKLHVGDSFTEQTIEHGGKVTLTPAQMAGYTFADWRLEGATAAFDKDTLVTSNLDLYARFTPNSYTITFDPDLGKEAQSVTYGDAYEIAAPTKTGYDFVTYKLNGAAFPLRGTYTTIGGIYLTAEFAIKKFDVTFLAADETKLAQQIEIEYGKKATAITVTGYDVDGYYLDKDFSEDKAVDLATYPITAETILYVKKTPKTYTLTVEGWHEASIRVTYGAAYALPAPEGETDADLLALLAAKVGTGVDNEWKAFTGYTYQNDTFAATGTYTYAANIVVTPHYTENEAYDKATVTFWDTVENESFKAVTVTRGDTVPVEEIPATAAGKTGYTFDGWFTTPEFTVGTAYNQAMPINAKVTVYAKYTAHAWTLTVKDTNADGATLLTIPVTYGQAVVGLPASIEKKGYTFTGYSAEVASPYMTDGNTTIYAQYTRNSVTVTFDGLKDATPSSIAAKTLNQYDALSAFLPASDPTKTGYTFKWWSLSQNGDALDGTIEVEVNTPVYAVFEANQYVITYDGGSKDVVYGQLYTLPNLEKYGYTFVGYTYEEEEFAQTGTYTYAQSITVTVVWEVNEGANFVKDETNGYFKERASAEDPYTYVFLEGGTYTFPGYTITSASDKVAITEGVSMRANTPGEFSFKATNTTSGLETVINAKIVYDIRSIGLAGDYEDMIAKANNSNNFQKTTTEANYVMTAGVSNFIPEISVLDANLSARTLEEANVSIVKEGQPLTYTLNGSAINFAESYTSAGTMTLTFAPKYSFGTSTVTLKVNLNNGVNVYTNEELKAAYSDMNVHKINVLRNITAELSKSDYESGYGVRGDILLKYKNGEMTQNVTLENRDLGVPKNVFGGGVYRRDSNIRNDSIEINGNYFSIDGTKLPYVDDALNRTAGAGYDLSNVQIGIFLYRSCEINDPGAYDDMNGVKYATASATINNLRIEGNNIKQYAAATADPLPGSELPYLKMSASYNGIVVRGGTLNLNNTTITNMNLGMMLHGGVSGYYKPGVDAARGGAADGKARDEGGQATVLVMKDSLIANCWTNSIYNYDLVKLTIENTRLGSSASAIIHFDDRPYGGSEDGSLGYSNLNSELVMDAYTAQHMENWVAGTEPWFIAYNQAGTATGIKTLMESEISSKGLTILRSYSGAQMMNFGIVVFPTADDKVSAWEHDKDGGAKIDIKCGFDTGKGLVFTFEQSDLTEEEHPALKTLMDTIAEAQSLGAQAYAKGEAATAAYMAGDNTTGAALQAEAESLGAQALDLQNNVIPLLVVAAAQNDHVFVSGGAGGITVYIPGYKAAS